jgi:Zn-dependent protease
MVHIVREGEIRENQGRMETFVLIGTIIVVVFSITTHEAAHAWVADRLGDPTARLLGRVTLNPVPHIDLFMTILLPGFLLISGSSFVFGGAKPVPVNLGRLRNPPRDWALVAIAGPISNLLLSLLFTGMFAALVGLNVFSPLSMGAQVLIIGVYANALLAVFNLIPIPPLDGSRVVLFLLRGEARESYARLERFGILIVLLLLFYVDGFGALLWGSTMTIMEGVTRLFGVEHEAALALGSLFS